MLGANPAAALLAGPAPTGPTWLDTATVTVAPHVYDLSAGANWVGGVAPVFGDTAIFGATTTPNTSVNVATPGTYFQIDGFYFAAGAPAYTFSVTNSNYLQFFGAGIVNGANATINTVGSATQFYGSSSAGAATFTNAGSAATAFYATSSAGTATIINNSFGSTAFYADSNAAQATITNNSNGNTQFQNSSSAGDATITNNSGGQTIFYHNSTGGNARLIANLGGGVDFSNSIGPLGDNKLTAGSIEGAGNFNIGGKTVTVGGNNLSTTVTGAIVDSGLNGTFIKDGTGTLTLAGHNLFSGTTKVNAGTLLVDGLLSGATNYALDGGTFGGTGIIGSTNTFINTGGTLAPGAPTATGLLSFTGRVTFSPDSFYLVKISTTDADRVNSATAILNGVVKVKPISIITQTTTYTILDAAFGRTGTFTSAIIDGAPFARNPTLSYSANKVFLTVDPGLLTLLLQPGVTGTPQQIAQAIDAALLAGVTLPAGFNGVFNLTGDALVAALKQLSGQSASGAQQASSDASNSFMGAMFDPFAPGRVGGTPAPGFASEDNDDAMAYAPRKKASRAEREARKVVFTKGPRNNLYDPRWSVWGSAYGSSTTTDGSVAAGTNTTTARAYGFVTGADYNLNRNTTVGFAIGGGSSNYGVAGNLGSGRADMFQLGLFGKRTFGAAYVTGGLGYTFQNVTTDRTVTIAGTDQLQAKFNANTFSGRVEGGYRFATRAVGITSYAALQVTTIGLPNYGEVAISGNNTFALNYNAQDTTIVRTELGARFDRSFALQTAMLTLRGRAAWAHDEGNNRAVSAVFGSLPGSNFTINGAVPSKDLALVSAGAEVTWLNNVSLAGTFEGQFSSTTTGYGGKGTVRYVW